MRLRTHNIFGFAIALLVLRTWLYKHLLLTVFSSIFLSLSINWFIDHVAGHKGYRRTPYTHSFVTSAIIAVIITLLYLYALRLLGVYIPMELLYGAVAIAVSHILLDMVTKDGVYPLWPFSRGRVSVLGIRYDNPIVNIFFVIVSIAIVAVILLDMARYYL